VERRGEAVENDRPREEPSQKFKMTSLVVRASRKQIPAIVEVDQVIATNGVLFKSQFMFPICLVAAWIRVLKCPEHLTIRECL